MVPVGPGWIDHFQRTVENTVSVQNEEHLPEELMGTEEIRIWGTTESKSHKKRAHFEKMDTDDIVLFYNDGEFFSSARVDQKFDDPLLGEAIWDNPGSRWIYTLSDFNEISLFREELWELLGYEEGYQLRGMERVTNERINSLLQQYNSVEEALQDFREDSDGSDTTDVEIEESMPSEEGVRTHTEIQWTLVQLGFQHNYEVYVAPNDQNTVYNGRRLGENCVEELPLSGFSDAAMKIIRYVDVIWIKDNSIVKMFEVESTTSIYSGILRMTDFVVKVPNLAVEMYIVAAGEDEDKVRQQMNRPTFSAIMNRANHSTLRFLSFEEVRETFDVVERAGPLQTVF